MIDNNKASDVKHLLMKILKLYKSNSEIVDHIHTELLSSNQYNQNLSLANNRDNKVVKIK